MNCITKQWYIACKSVVQQVPGKNAGHYINNNHIMYTHVHTSILVLYRTMWPRSCSPEPCWQHAVSNRSYRRHRVHKTLYSSLTTKQQCLTDFTPAPLHDWVSSLGVCHCAGQGTTNYHAAGALSCWQCSGIATTAPYENMKSSIKPEVNKFYQGTGNAEQCKGCNVTSLPREFSQTMLTTCCKIF